MSGPKKWVSSKVHRRSASKSSLSSHNSGSSPLDVGAPPSPPTRIPNNEDTTAATAMVDFGSGSTLMTRAHGGGHHSNSSIDSFSTGLTQSPLTWSPSTTPPKKTWERNYRSFLRKTGIHTKVPPIPRVSTQQHQYEVPIKPLPRAHHHSHKPPRSSSENATSFLSKSHQHLPHLFTHHHNHDASSEDLGPDLADGFEDHSPTKNNDTRTALAAPLSPLKPRESGTHRGTFFKRLRGKTKSTDNLDATMRKGVDRKSPTNTPSGSAASTPIHKSSPSVSYGVTALQERIEKSAMLSEALTPPPLTSSTSLGYKSTSLGYQSTSPGSHNQRLDHAVCPTILPQGDLNDNQLDQARHRGYSVSMAPSTIISQPPLTTTSTIPPSQFCRVQSMGSNLVIPEGEPAIVHKEELIREKKKAFTDFHNTGIDSSSAYLGDESSLHRQSVFISSMAYPAGSAGSKKCHSRHTVSSSGAYSLDQKSTNISPSTSLGCVSETTTQHPESGADFSPERALRSLKGPEQWTKGEKNAILPGVLSMCPIQVLNNIMSKEEVPPSRPSLTSRGSHSGFGIGSIISQDEGADSNGWFFADHHQPTPAGGMLPCHGGSVSSSTVLPSVFGKIVLGKATVAPLGMRSFFNEVYGWCTGVFILRQNYLFEYREGDSLNGLPWGYAHLPLAEVYPHKHFTNALHMEFFEKPCSKSGKRSLLIRVENKGERDRWVSLLQSAARMTMHDLYDVDESEGAPEFGNGRYAVVRPAKRRDRRMAMSYSDTRYPHTTTSQESFRNVSSYDSLGGGKSSNPDLQGAVGEYDCALKIIDKTEFWSLVKKGRERADTLVREAAVQTTLAVQGVDTPGFLRLRNIFETGEKLVLELELLKGTDLFQHVSSRGILHEVEAAHIMRDLLNCLNVLDQVGIAHRDIKPANLLMCHNEENNDGPKIKLADYGMASFVGVDNLVRGRCGTPGFVAPEILLTGVNGGYGNKVDMFSAGVTLYVMLAGYEPFYGESDAELIDANREARVDFPHADWHTVSIEGRDLIERLLVVDPSKRIGPSEALRHPWITRRATAPLSED